jgi:CheY-like chemotaxis protein
MRNKTILLVEDNGDDEALTLRAFKKHNIANEVVVARSGEEAIEHLLGPTTAHLPSIMLLDLNLPKMNGLDVLKRVRADERTKTLPVVVLTSSKEDQDLIHSYSLGANAYVRKPVDFAQFSEAIRTLGLFWLVLNELPPGGG